MLLFSIPLLFASTFRKEPWHSSEFIYLFNWQFCNFTTFPRQFHRSQISKSILIFTHPLGFHMAAGSPNLSQLWRKWHCCGGQTSFITSMHRWVIGRLQVIDQTVQWLNTHQSWLLRGVDDHSSRFAWEATDRSWVVFLAFSFLFFSNTRRAKSPRNQLNRGPKPQRSIWKKTRRSRRDLNNVQSWKTKALYLNP